LLGCDGAAPLDAATDDAGRDAGADAGPPLVVASVEDLGALPSPSETAVGRDGVSSGVVDGQLLWAFGDTFLSMTTPVDGSNVASATGGWATPDDPFAIEQPVDANGIPPQLIPYTEDELAQNRLDALDGWALWPAAVIDTGDPELLVLFQRVKRTDGSMFDGVGLAAARIAPRATVATRDGGDLFSRPLEGGGTPLYGVGGVSVIDDAAYFFACELLGCNVGRVPRDRADDRSAFEFYDGSAWVTDIERARAVIDNVGAMVSVTWNPHLGAFLAVTGRRLSNDVLLRTAPSVVGPWPSYGVVISPAEGGIIAAGEGNNYLAQEHAALSAPDGSSIVISYSRPLGFFRGEVRLARITFE
jgi:hypothetical protein